LHIFSFWWNHFSSSTSSRTKSSWVLSTTQKFWKLPSKELLLLAQ
jgi:hypothetical protein